MLEVRNMSSGYGSVPVLRNVSLSMQPGEIVLVAGENGAGKSTLLRTIAGFIRAESGSIALAGANIVGLAPETIARSGLRLVLDGHRVFPEISVFDNLRLGGAIRAAGRAAFEEVYAVFPVLKEKSRQFARDLSGGQQQMLALAQAFLARPRVLLCDEPSTGLAQALLPPILGFIRRWASSGTAVLIVEQQLDLALPIAHRAVLMERGEVALTCAAEQLKSKLTERKPS
jgi:branched-chain amino acid transport system ATP-binding protein